MNREENIRVRQIVTHPLYQQEFSALQKAEQERIYCKHTMEHFLDVARICHIMSTAGSRGDLTGIDLRGGSPP